MKKISQFAACKGPKDRFTLKVLPRSELQFENMIENLINWKTQPIVKIEELKN